MNIIIIPFEGDFEILKDAIEYSSVDAHEAYSIISKEIVPGKSYHLCIAKNKQDELNLVFGKEGVSLFRLMDDLGTDNTIEIDSFQEAINLALEYLRKNGTASIDSYVQSKKKNKEGQKNQQLQEWRNRYYAKEKKDKKRFYIRFTAVMTGVLIIFAIVYLLWTGEMQFVGRNTDQTTGIVTKAEFKRSGRAVFQYVVYEFSYEGKNYEGRFKANRFTGRFYEGEEILVKFRTSDPTYSKRINWE